MFIDTHMHEMTYSPDSFLELEEMVRIGKEKGLGALCITDHDSMGLKDYAAEYTARTGFPIFVGIEFYSIDLVKAQGGVCFAAHPFRNNNRGLEENLAVVRGLDGVEVLNGSTSFAACMKAAAYARQYGYFTLGSSDCHVPEKVGVCATYFPNEVRTMDEFLTEFKKGQMKPAYYVQGGYRVLEVQNNDKKVQNSIKIPFTFPARSDSMYL